MISIMGWRCIMFFASHNDAMVGSSIVFNIYRKHNAHPPTLNNTSTYFSSTWRQNTQRLPLEIGDFRIWELDGGTWFGPTL
jgi:hypothetical protein